jgi:pimeloyl-ACP methyl ester carboxylesterase
MTIQDAMNLGACNMRESNIGSGNIHESRGPAIRPGGANKAAVWRWVAAQAVVLWLAGLAAGAQQVPTAITTDPAIDTAHPASMTAFQIPSHGEKLNAIAYLAAGAGPHPVVILLHGFPGNEKNLDLAQAIRRAGWNVIFFNYRGSWGTPGAFSFGHSIEDTQAAVAWIRMPENAARLHTDPKRVVLIGHSMGGFMAAYAGSHDQGILATGLISAADMATMAKGAGAGGDSKAAIGKLAEGLEKEDILPLAGCTGLSLAQELVSHQSDWEFAGYVAGFGSRPLLVVTSNDGLAGHGQKVAEIVGKNPTSHVTLQHFATDHSYSDQRIALETTVLNWLGTL